MHIALQVNGRSNLPKSKSERSFEKVRWVFVFFYVAKAAFKFLFSQQTQQTVVVSEW